MKGLFEKMKLRHKKLFLVLLDIVLINFSYFFALLLMNQYGEVKLMSFLMISVIYILVFTLFKLYDSLWRFAGSYEFLNIILANVVSWSGFVLLSSFLTNFRYDFSLKLIFFIITLVFTVAIRMSYRFLRRYVVFLKTKSINSCMKPKKVMIIGAGYTGSLIIKEMLSNVNIGYEPSVVIDDDKSKWGSYINKVKVVGGRKKIIHSAKNENIDVIIIAMARVTIKQKTEIINICKETGCELKIIPAYNEILGEKVFLSKIRDVNVEDLLGREPVKLDMKGISDYLEKQTVLVTGGGGSIGSEICRQVSRFKPKRLIIVDIYENNAYDLQNELKRNYPNLKLSVLIASVRDKKRLMSIFAKYKPDVVFHAAAHKHVPLMEVSPGEAIKNNIFGTLNTAECADTYGVKRFVQISTDKAVNPTNIMGATKRVCEMIVQSIDKISKTKFVAVRFGNVLGSNGSVIPLFKKQIKEGGPVTLTHKDIIRYFMTIPEASQLVLQAGGFAEGGEIFVLDMGEPVKIYDLASDLIKLSGFEPGKDIKIEITGLRPGEKLYEELLMAEENMGKTRHDKIFIGQATDISFQKLRDKLAGTRIMVESENEEVIFAVVRDLVPTFKHEDIEKDVKEDIVGNERVAVAVE